MKRALLLMLLAMTVVATGLIPPPVSAQAQESCDPEFDPRCDGRGGGQEPIGGRECGPDSVSGRPCQTEEFCKGITRGNRCIIDDPAFDPGERDAEGIRVACTAEEAGGGSRQLICTAPAPPDAEVADDPDGGVVREVTRVVEEPCDAQAPPPAWDAADLPAQTINLSPTPEHHGVTGLDTWLWASGERAHYWTQTGFGVVTRLTYARDGVVDGDGDVDWGQEYLLETQTWGCAVQVGFWARITRWDWELRQVRGGDRLHTASGDRAGSEPAVDSDGDAASARIMPQTKGRYAVTLETVWESDWGGSHRQSHAPVDYLVDEIRGQLGPARP